MISWVRRRFWAFSVESMRGGLIRVWAIVYRVICLIFVLSSLFLRVTVCDIVNFLLTLRRMCTHSSVGNNDCCE